MNQNYTNLVATSTVAMTVVSLLAQTGPLTLEGLWNALDKCDYQIDPGPLRHALEQALERRLVSRNGDVFASALPEGWVVRSRDPEDPEGWRGWIAQSPDGRSRLLSNLQAEIA